MTGEGGCGDDRIYLTEMRIDQKPEQRVLIGACYGENEEGVITRLVVAAE